MSYQFFVIGYLFLGVIRDWFYPVICDSFLIVIRDWLFVIRDLFLDVIRDSWFIFWMVLANQKPPFP